MKPFDLTPHPKIYIAITNTKMQPIDALCELIDNAIDSFQVARLQGSPVEHPMVIVNLPKLSELNRNEGVLRIRDNGPGMTPEKAELALKAGFSGNNPYDSLGLFGMGFNISTGKFGQITKFLTVQRGGAHAVEAIIDLEHLRRTESFEVVPAEVPRPEGFEHGTLIEISGWWPPGNQNSDFVKKLVQYGMPTIRREIGRRYATILRNGNTRIIINDEACTPYEHCHWSESRSVDRRGVGIIQAVHKFDQIIGSQTRCMTCTSLITENNDECQLCGNSGFRTIDERIRGWVGIQRYDHETDFGIDLIRNGRAIRIEEKSAFFEYIDEFKKITRDYPVDQIYGRIIGEVHMNHVPVDFTKEDFQRSSVEWQKAMSFLRGDTPLQPGLLKPGESNESPIYKLYQGYRRVRKPGRTDMYMGYWDKDADGPKRISRDVEREYRSRFEKREPGFYDDAEWWKLVEQADQRPLDELITCPNCQGQNLKEHDSCTVCGTVLIGKACLNDNCGALIPESAASCPDCGVSQVPEIQQQWVCKACRRSNSPSADVCIDCGLSAGNPDPLSKEFLLENSNKVDELSFPGCSIKLADSSYSTAIDVDTYVTNGPMIPTKHGEPIPLLVFKDEKIFIFLDKAHSLFKSYRIHPEELIAGEIALYIYDSNRRLTNAEYRSEHTLSNISWKILKTRWSEALEDSPDRVRGDVIAFFELLKERLPVILPNSISDLFDDLGDDAKKALVDNMIGQNIDLSKFVEMKSSGRFTRFLSARDVTEIFHRYPVEFFDGNFWSDSFSSIAELPVAVVEKARNRTHEVYFNCLDDLVSFLDYSEPDSIIVHRARASLEFLQQRVA